MEKKTIEKQTVLMYSTTTTLATLMSDAGEIPREIESKARELGLEITAPPVWQYVGVDGKPDTRFNMDICLPVNGAKGNAGKFRFVELPEINCITEIHKGSWYKLADTYNQVFGEMSRKGIVPAGASREVYHTCDFENEANNVTEIQVIIQ
ncbi:GyrI-like domain-containing protein [Sunxiuqinia indica]|uniref:GyrI-like domain-containing protein n=1 Tax=Sunxiuqinia indica TaxID=2692584 RepID=UPI0013574627|nr:GyrI-like domain-containing protein [Sunxiuqinia indica]